MANGALECGQPKVRYDRDTLAIGRVRLEAALAARLETRCFGGALSDVLDGRNFMAVGGEEQKAPYAQFVAVREHIRGAHDFRILANATEAAGITE
jgi:hypothetical protein